MMRMRRYRGIFTSETKDSDHEQIMQDGLSFGGPVPIATGLPVEPGNTIAQALKIERTETPSGVQAHAVEFEIDVVRGDLVPVVQGIAYEVNGSPPANRTLLPGEPRVITKARVTGIALVKRSESANPDCDLVEINHAPEESA